MEEDNNTQPTVQSSPFDAIRRVDEQGREYWNARDLARLLGYRQYTNFTGAIHKAEIACKESGEGVPDHFLHTQEMICNGLVTVLAGFLSFFDSVLKLAVFSITK